MAICKNKCKQLEEANDGQNFTPVSILKFIQSKSCGLNATKITRTLNILAVSFVTKITLFPF